MPAFSLTVNNLNYTVDAEADTPLLWVLRDELPHCVTTPLPPPAKEFINCLCGRFPPAST